MSETTRMTEGECLFTDLLAFIKARRSESVELATVVEKLTLHASSPDMIGLSVAHLLTIASEGLRSDSKEFPELLVLAARTILHIRGEGAHNAALEILRLRTDYLEAPPMVIRALVNEGEEGLKVLSSLSPFLVARACGGQIETEEIPQRFGDSVPAYRWHLLERILDSPLLERILPGIDLDQEEDHTWLEALFDPSHSCPTWHRLVCKILLDSAEARDIFARQSEEQLRRFMDRFTDPWVDALADAVGKMREETLLNYPQLGVLRAFMLGFPSKPTDGSKTVVEDLFFGLPPLTLDDLPQLIGVHGREDNRLDATVVVGKTDQPVPIWSRIAANADSQASEAIGRSAFKGLQEGSLSIEVAIRIIPLCGEVILIEFWGWLLTPANLRILGKARRLCAKELCEASWRLPAGRLQSLETMLGVIIWPRWYDVGTRVEKILCPRGYRQLAEIAEQERRRMFWVPATPRP